HSKNNLIHNQKVMDLGISKLYNDDVTRTRSRELKGTITYLELQCILNPTYECAFKSDIYSIGVLYWELTTGRSPFQNASTHQILLNISLGLREDPNPVTPIEYVNLYKKSWDLFPENRQQLNEVYNIVSNIMSEADKKFDEYILKTEQYISESNTMIANLFQEFIILYTTDMATNSDDTANDHRETILAYFYMKGFGTNKDYEKCLYWCKKGCAKKNVYSYYEAAFCYGYSLSISENYNEAFRYFNLAAGGGVLKAKRELAIMHMNGMGCEENKAKAFCLFKEAGEQDKIACCMIGDCSYDGIGIEVNLIEALKCYKICWKKWEYPNAVIRIPLIEAKLEDIRLID
ncbi:10056_t:CDS:2, partial [Racocetra persica]